VSVSELIDERDGHVPGNGAANGHVTPKRKSKIKKLLGTNGASRRRAAHKLAKVV
jgi:hypothetical protein